MFSRVRHYFKSWQDTVIGVGGFALFFSLIPMIFAEVPPPLTSSGLVALVLGSYVICFITMRLWLSAIGLSLQTIIWTILVIQGLGER